jgi:hypothetical protein
MKRDDLRPDAELRAMLRRFDSPDRVSPDQRAALQRRIAADAEPLLSARRPGSPAWWEFTAGWARTLIPLGVATAMVAAGLILWAAHTPVRQPLVRVASQDSLVSAVPRDRTSQHLLDLLVSPAVIPADEPAAPPGIRR